MLIRKIQTEDNAAVAQIIRLVMTECGAVGAGFSIEDPEVDAMHDAYSSERAVFYVLEDDGELVGCGGLAALDGGDETICEIKKMYFLPEARGLGHGRILGEMLLVDASRFEFKRAYIETLESMLAAQSLYMRLGFEEIEGPLGATGHHGCDKFFAKDLLPAEMAPELLR
ncbi:MAG: GNAT family N-acetyltransferase [Pirellulaceae bacterium]